MLIVESLIKSGHWVIAFEKSLALVSAYSEIKYGEKYSASKKFRKWFKTYVIDSFDDIANKCEILKIAKLNGQSVTSSMLKSISLNDVVIEKAEKKQIWDKNRFKLEHILYKIRCTDFHTQARVMKDITINDKSPIFRLRLDEDSIYKKVLQEENPIIYLCPQFFCWLIMFSIDNFIKIMPTEEEAVKNRFNNFISYNVDSIEITLKANSVDYSSDSCGAGLHAIIAADKPIEVNEKYFSVECNNSRIVVNYTGIKEIVKGNDFNILFDDLIGNYTGLSINLSHPKLEELYCKLNIKKKRSLI